MLNIFFICPKGSMCLVGYIVAHLFLKTIGYHMSADIRSTKKDYTDIARGTSSFEIIEFSLNRRLPNGKMMKGTYGLNVAKVREVLRMPKINPLASNITGYAGVFELRGVPIPAINLSLVLGDAEAPLSPDQWVIITEFSMKRVGLIVAATHKIRKLPWDKVLPPSIESGAFITGLTLIENNEFLFILDLEKIIMTLEGQAQAQRHMSMGGSPAQQKSENQSTTGSSSDQTIVEDGPKVLVVDDSNFILHHVKNNLQKFGYRVETASNGSEALKILESAFEDESSDTGMFDILVTDIEMPQMDGFSLIKAVRKNPLFRDLPIVVHSSISSSATMDAAKKAGANTYVVKSDVDVLHEKLKEFVKNLTDEVA